MLNLELLYLKHLKTLGNSPCPTPGAPTIFPCLGLLKQLSDFQFFLFQFSVVSSKGLQLFLPSYGTVRLLFRLSVSSEYSPRARQTCRLCCQEPLPWIFTSPSQISIRAPEVRSCHRELLLRSPSALLKFMHPSDLHWSTQGSKWG